METSGECLQETLPNDDLVSEVSPLALKDSLDVPETSRRHATESEIEIVADSALVDIESAQISKVNLLCSTVF